MALDDVFKEGEDVILLDEVREESRASDGHIRNPIKTYFEKKGFDITQPAFATGIAVAERATPRENDIALGRIYAAESTELISAVRANRSDIVNFLNEETLYEFLLPQKPVITGGLADIHKKAHEAYVLTQNKEEIQKRIGDYVNNNIMDLETKGVKKHVLDYLTFEFKKNPKLAQEAVIGEINKSITAFKEAITKSIPTARAYTDSLYNGLTDQKDKDGFDFGLGRIATLYNKAKKAPAPAPPSP